MPVVHRPPAAPRGVHRRPAAASELPYLVSVVGPASENEARKYETKKHTKMEAEFKRTTVEQAQAISRGTGVCEKKAPRTNSRQTPSPPTIQC